MNDETFQEAEAWIAKARSDLKAAEILATGENSPQDIAIYHCQQSAEKAIKGFLVFREIPFQKTHDLERLLELVREDSTSLVKLDEHARILTPYAVEFRYPGDVFEPDEAEMLEALRLAREVLDHVVSLIKK